MIIPRCAITDLIDLGQRGQLVTKHDEKTHFSVGERLHAYLRIKMFTNIFK